MFTIVILFILAVLAFELISRGWDPRNTFNRRMPRYAHRRGKVRVSKEAGMAMLLAELVAVGILGVLLAIALPNIVTMMRYQRAQNALVMMRAVQAGESWYDMTYGNGFADPLFLVGYPGQPRTCDNPKMLNMAYAPNGIIYGYQFTFSHGEDAHQLPPPPGCSNGGWSSFKFTATPVMGGRSWYVDPTSGIRYSDTGPANAESEFWRGN